MERNTEEYHADNSNEKRRFLQTDVQTDHPDHYTESAQCSSEFRGCYYAKLCGTVRNIRSIPGVKFFECSVYGILRTGDGSHSLVRPILWKGEPGSNSYCRRNHTSFLYGNLRYCCADCIFPSSEDDASVYFGCGADHHRCFLSADHGYHIPVLGHHGIRQT